MERTSYENDYLDDVPEVEHERDVDAVKLSWCFLKYVNAEQRKIIVAHLIHLGIHYHFSSSIIYQAVRLFDVVINYISVETDDIQLMSLACLWISLKREANSHKIPSANVILQLAKGLHNNRERCLLLYEKRVLSAVNFSICFPDPFSSLTYYMTSIIPKIQYAVTEGDTRRIYFCSSYLIDITMLDDNLCDLPTCVSTMIALELSLIVVLPRNVNLKDTWCQFQQNNSSKFTRWEKRAIDFAKPIFTQLALKSREDSELIVVYKKYLQSRYARISDFLLNRLKEEFPLCMQEKYSFPNEKSDEYLDTE